jgi:hypothetical protein
MKTSSVSKETEDEDEFEDEDDDGNDCEAASPCHSLDRDPPGHSFFGSNRPRPRSKCWVSSQIFMRARAELLDSWTPDLASLNHQTRRQGFAEEIGAIGQDDGNERAEPGHLRGSDAGFLQLGGDSVAQRLR